MMTNKEKKEVRNEVLEVYSNRDIDAKVAVKRLYYLWILSFDSEFNFLSDIIGSKNLKKEYESLSEKFLGDPCFLFFIGYILDVEPWALISNYEDDMDAFDVMGQQFMEKANKLDYNVNIYNWGVASNPNEKRCLASKILSDSSKFPLNDKVMGQYFKRIFKSQIQEA